MGIGSSVGIRRLDRVSVCWLDRVRGSVMSVGGVGSGVSRGQDLLGRRSVLDESRGVESVGDAGVLLAHRGEGSIHSLGVLADHGAIVGADDVLAGGAVSRSLVRQRCVSSRGRVRIGHRRSSRQASASVHHDGQKDDELEERM